MTHAERLDWLQRRICRPDRTPERAKPYRLTLGGDQWDVATNGPVLVAFGAESGHDVAPASDRYTRVVGSVLGATDDSDLPVYTLGELRAFVGEPKWPGPCPACICPSCGTRHTPGGRMCLTCGDSGRGEDPPRVGVRIMGAAINANLLAQALEGVEGADSDPVQVRAFTDGPDQPFIRVRGAGWRIVIMGLAGLPASAREDRWPEFPARQMAGAA